MNGIIGHMDWDDCYRCKYDKSHVISVQGSGGCIVPIEKWRQNIRIHPDCPEIIECGCFEEKEK